MAGPVEERPVEERPVEERPVEGRPREEGAAEGRGVGGRGGEERSVEEVVETPEPAPAPPRRLNGWRRLPVVRQLAQSVGLQRGMLVAGLVLSAGFLLTAIFAPLLAPYEYNQLRDPSGPFGAQQPPSSQHLLGTTVGG